MRWILAAAGALLLGTRLYLLIRFSQDGFIQGGDTHSYLKPALGWLADGELGHHRMYRAPGLPLAIAALLWLESWLGDLRGAAVIAFQMALGAFNLLLLHAFARRVLGLGPRAALGAVVVAGLFTQALVYTYVLQSEIWFETFIVGAALAYGLALSAEGRLRDRWLVVGAAVLSASLWFRPTLFLAPPLVALALLAARRLRAAGATAALFLVSLLPLCAGFHSQFGRWYPIVQFTGAFQTDLFWPLMREREGPVGTAVARGVEAIVEDKFGGAREALHRRYCDFTFAAFSELLDADESLGRVDGLELLGREARAAALGHPVTALGLLADNAARFWSSEYTYEAAFNFIPTGGEMRAAHWEDSWRVLEDRWNPAFDAITRYVLPAWFFALALALCATAACLPGPPGPRAGLAVAAGLALFVWLTHSAANFVVGRYRAPLEGLLVVSFAAAAPVLIAKLREARARRRRGAPGRKGSTGKR
jgi:hypothetical protein